MSKNKSHAVANNDASTSNSSLSETMNATYSNKSILQEIYHQPPSSYAYTNSKNNSSNNTNKRNSYSEYASSSSAAAAKNIYPSNSNSNVNVNYGGAGLGGFASSSGRKKREYFSYCI